MHKIITFIESESEILAVKCYAVLCSVVSDSLWPHGLQPARLLGPWESLGKTTGVVCKALLQGIFPTQGLNPGFSHCKQILHHLSYKGSPAKGSVQFSSVQFSLSVVSDSLRPHESQHARPPCPSPTPGVYPNSCPSSQWCHPAISSSVTSFSSRPQSLSASGSFPMSQLVAWGDQSTGVSASASVLQMC